MTLDIFCRLIHVTLGLYRQMFYMQVWSDFSHPQCVKQCWCPPPPLASFHWITISFRHLHFLL